MNLQEILSNPEKSFIYLERYVNDGSPSGFSINSTSYATNPKGLSQSFQVALIQFNKNIEIIDFGENKLYDLPPNTVFCHPDNMSSLEQIKEHWKQVGSIEVVPTASGRTVKCIGKNSFFIKLDYKGILGRTTRNLNSKKLFSALEVNDILVKAINKRELSSMFSFFEESFGRCARLPMENGSYYEMGFVFRDDHPHPLDPRVVAYIPFFSLFSKDSLSPVDELIATQLYQYSGKSANDLFLNIIGSVIQCYFDTLTHCGLCLEAHAQNLLLGIDKEYHLVSIIVRDLESVDKDLPLRKILGLNTHFDSEPYKCLYDSDYNYTIKHSFMFDFKLGKYVIDPLINVFKNFKNFEVDLVISNIKELINQNAQMLPKDYFPSQWYDYENKVYFNNENRPYIAHDTPRYR